MSKINNLQRIIKVKMTVTLWGEKIEKVFEIKSPLVSEDNIFPQVQKDADNYIAQLALDTGYTASFEIVD